MRNLQNRLNLCLAKLTQVKLLLAWDSRMTFRELLLTPLFCDLKTELFMLKCKLKKKKKEEVWFVFFLSAICRKVNIL